MIGVVKIRGSNVGRSIGISWSLCRKNLEGKYARSTLGLLWLPLTPIATLCLYWSVFGLVLGVEWPAEASGKPPGYIVPFMSGLAIFLFFGSVVSGSLGVFISRRNYVRKSPIKLWVLWLAEYMGSVITGLINLALLLLLSIFYGFLTLKGLLWAIPTVVLMFVLFGGLSLTLALIGPFWGDVANSVSVVLRFIFYTAPITFPLAIVPLSVQWILWLNPLTSLVEMLRGSIVFSNAPSPIVLLAMAALTGAMVAFAIWLYGRVADAVRDIV